jgi:ATP-dependent protease ClpP protease subunit
MGVGMGIRWRVPGIIKEDIDRWYSLGVYPRTRTIYLGNIAEDDDGGDETFTEDWGIHWNTSRRVIMGIHLLDSNAQNGSKPITIIMNSCGGDWSHGMAIFDAVRSSKNHVTIINMSHARSMTSIILQAADYRITSPHGYYLIHDGNSSDSAVLRACTPMQCSKRITSCQ